MSNDTTQQSVLFKDLLDKPLHARFDQSDSSSDGGAILLKAADERLGLSESLAACLRDKRDPEKVVHSMHDLLRQRVPNHCINPVNNLVKRPASGSPNNATTRISLWDWHSSSV